MPIKMLLSNDFIVLQVIKKKKNVEVFLIIARSHNYWKKNVITWNV